MPTWAQRVHAIWVCAYFEKIFNPFLSVFRKGYSCQSVLLAISEELRSELDGGAGGGGM